MKIAILITKLSGSGAEKIAITLAQMFQKRDNEVHLISLEQTLDYEIDSIKVHYLTKKLLNKQFFYLFDLYLSKKLKGLIDNLEKNSKFDLILSNLPYCDKIASMCNFQNIYYIIHTNYSMELENFKAKNRYFRAFKKERFYKKLYQNRDLITVSDGIKSDILENLKIEPKSIERIYNPFDFEKIRELSNESIDFDFEYILNPSAFRVDKRHDILLEAFSLIKSDIKLLLLTKPFKALIELIERFNLQDRVIILGFQQNPYKFFKNAKLTVLSSQREGLPTVLIESLICDTLVVSTNCKSGPSEILTDSLNNYLVEVNNIQELAEKIDWALAQDTEIKKHYLEKFKEENIYNEYIKLAKSE